MSPLMKRRRQALHLGGVAIDGACSHWQHEQYAHAYSLSAPHVHEMVEVELVGEMEICHQLGTDPEIQTMVRVRYASEAGVDQVICYKRPYGVGELTKRSGGTDGS